MMIKNRVSSVVAALSLFGAMLALPAVAAPITINTYEVAWSYVFNGNGGPGSTITVRAHLYTSATNRTKIGSKEEFCQITGYNQMGQPLLWCIESLVFTGKGGLTSIGQINQTLIEAGIAQTIPVTAGSGIYAGRKGTQKIQQIVFPTEYQLTIKLN